MESKVGTVCSHAQKQMSTTNDLAKMRRDYNEQSLDENLLTPEQKESPWKLFDTWVKEAEVAKMATPRVFCFTTADEKMRPTARYQNMKDYDD